METLATIWHRATEHRPAAIAGSVAVILLGVALIAIGEVFDWGWTRLVGAGVISIAAIAVGALFGWSDPLRPRIAGVMGSWSRAILMLLTVIMVAPLMIGLVMLFGGAIVGGITATWSQLLAGVFISMFFILITLGTVATAVSLAFRGLWKAKAEDPAAVNGQDAE